MSLEEFAKHQKNKREAVSEQLNKINTLCRINVKDCIKTILNELRANIVSQLVVEEEQRKN
jgi:hypothetical protein